VGEFLTAWLAEKVAAGLRPTTARSYAQHVRDHLVPKLGHLRLRDLRPGHVEAMLRPIGAGPSTVRRIHATLRSALATAKRRRLVAFNAAVDVELPKASRPKMRPWEPAELGAFLDHAAGARLGRAVRSDGRDRAAPRRGVRTALGRPGHRTRAPGPAAAAGRHRPRAAVRPAEDRVR
jgi:hypothetical protein